MLSTEAQIIWDFKNWATTRDCPYNTIIIPSFPSSQGFTVMVLSPKNSTTNLRQRIKNN